MQKNVFLFKISAKESNMKTGFLRKSKEIKLFILFCYFSCELNGAGALNYKCTKSSTEIKFSYLNNSFYVK